jgi:hypothetical protein
MWISFFNKKGRLLYSPPLCHILPGIETLVILGGIIDGKKLCWQGPYSEHMGSWGPMMTMGNYWIRSFLKGQGD